MTPEHLSANDIKLRVRAALQHSLRLAHSPRFVAPTGPVVRLPTVPANPQLADLLALDGEAFVRASYQRCLGRDPDASGLAGYGERLARGSITKVGLLGRLAYSKEGRARKRKIPGLFARFVADLGQQRPATRGVTNLALTMKQLARAPKQIGALERQALEQPHQMWAAHIRPWFDQAERSLNDDREQFASSVQRVLALSHRTSQRLDNVERDLSTAVATLSQRLGAGDVANADLKGVIETVQQSVSSLRAANALTESALRQVRAGAPTAETPTHDPEAMHAFDAFYAEFEQKFRGTPQLIRQRLAVYLPYVQRAMQANVAAPILDLGCGRGEWLELMREQGFVARGVDSNRVALASCRERNLDVVEGDVVAHLQRQETGSHGVITAFHVAEHLPFPVLIAMLDEACRVLRPGGLLILETPNPENLIVGACNFYYDPTHQRPLPPPALEFMVGARGYLGVSILRLARPENAMPELPAGAPIDASVSLMRYLLSAPPDYAIIGYAPEANPQ